MLITIHLIHHIPNAFSFIYIVDQTLFKGYSPSVNHLYNPLPWFKKIFKHGIITASDASKIYTFASSHLSI